MWGSYQRLSLPPTPCSAGSSLGKVGPPCACCRGIKIQNDLILTLIVSPRANFISWLSLIIILQTYKIIWTLTCSKMKSWKFYSIFSVLARPLPFFFAFFFFYYYYRCFKAQILRELKRVHFFLSFFFFFFFLVFLPFLGPPLQHMEVPRLGVESEL